MLEENKVRVRFAPSPTGKLHMGSARTALFNYLFAKKKGGVFMLRIEDTDIARSSKELENEIISELKQLGINWAEGPGVDGPFGPYHQSERFDIYKSYAEQLLTENKAFYCFCTADELARQKEEALRKGTAPRYSGKCKTLSKDGAELKLRSQKPVIRFNSPVTAVLITDKLRGEIKFEPQALDDFIILKSDGSPTYNFAAAIDDALMEITYVIRGEDHLTNTARQVAIYEAIDKKPPIFVHIGLILGPDKTKLSKRHGATSVGEYLEQGFLPEAVVNFLALLGWSDLESREIFSNIDEIAERFSIERLSPSPSIFDAEKLLWLNGEHIRILPDKELAARTRPFLEQKGLQKPPHLTNENYIDDWFVLLAKSFKDNLRTLSDAPILSEIFFKESVEFSEERKEGLKDETAREAINLLIEKIEPLKDEEIDLDFNNENSNRLISDLRAHFKQKNIGVKKFLHPLRVALTGQDSGPPLTNVIILLGKNRVLKNLVKALSF